MRERPGKQLVSLGLMGQLEIATAHVASAGGQFACQEANQRKLRPLADAKRLQQLLFGVLKSRTDGIYCGNRHACTSQDRLHGKVLRTGVMVKKEVSRAWN